MRLRTCQGVYDAIHAEDPGSEVSRHYIRRLILAEAVPVVHCGRKKLVDVDAVKALLEQGYQLPEEETVLIQLPRRRA